MSLTERSFVLDIFVLSLSIIGILCPSEILLLGPLFLHLIVRTTTPAISNIPTPTQIPAITPTGTPPEGTGKGGGGVGCGGGATGNG